MSLYTVAVIAAVLTIQTGAHTFRVSQRVLDNGDALTGPGTSSDDNSVLPLPTSSDIKPPGLNTGTVPAIASTKTEPKILNPSESGDKKENAVVTNGFCMQVLKEVANRQAPYFVDGKFTGECRQSLVDQCGDRICNWASKYKALASDCPLCPKSCDQTSPTRVAFFSSFPTVLSIVGTQKFYLAIKREISLRANPAQGSGTLPVGSGDKSSQAGSGSGVATILADSPCVGSSCPQTDVTKGFCKQMLKDIAAGKPPYFLEGKFTGESRTNLIHQCSTQICGWALRIQIAGIPKCGNSPCCLPETCKMPQQYIKDVVGRGQLLDIIRLVGKNSVAASLDPLNPPDSIPPQSFPKKTLLRGASVKEDDSIAPNDPRDTDLVSTDK